MQFQFKQISKAGEQWIKALFSSNMKKIQMTSKAGLTLPLVSSLLKQQIIKMIYNKIYPIYAKKWGWGE